MNDSEWMSEGLAKLGLVEWPEMLLHHLPAFDTASTNFQDIFPPAWPEVGRNFVKSPMAALTNFQRRTEEKYKNIYLLSSLAI